MDQDPEDILIELLNGRRGLFSSTTVSAPSNEVFLDNKGRPTDRFLEALKRTGTSVSSQRDDDGSDASDSSSTEDSSEEDDEEEDVFERSWSRKSSRKKSTGTRWEGATEGKANEHRGNRSAAKADVDIKWKKTNTSSNKNSNKSSLNNNSTIKGGPQQTSHSHHDTTDGGSSGTPVHTTPHTHDISSGGVPVSADSKEMKTIRSLQLRLSGQLQTIRVLEGQLGESNSLLETRNKQLSLVESRLKQMQLSMDNMNKGLDGAGTSSGSPSGGIPGSAASASKLLREVCVLLQYYLMHSLYIHAPPNTPSMTIHSLSRYEQKRLKVLNDNVHKPMPCMLDGWKNNHDGSEQTNAVNCSKNTQSVPKPNVPK